MTTLFCRQATTIITLMNMNARKQKVWLNFLGVVWRKERRRGRKLAGRGQRAAPSVIAHPKISPPCTIRCLTANQGDITCGAIDEPRKSSKAINKRVIINFRDKNVVSARFCDKNEAFILL